MAIAEFTTEELNEEVWASIPEWPAYEVSSIGRVRRKENSGLRFTDSRVLRPALTTHGYRCVSLAKFAGCKMKTVDIHILVAAAFIGPRTKGQEVNHKDSCRTNNRVANLEYVTRNENMRHASLMGRMRGSVGRGLRGGERAPRAVLTEVQVREILTLLNDGMGPYQVAPKFGVCPKTIYLIRDGVTWRCVPR